MEIIEFKKMLQENFALLTKDATCLFEIDVDMEEFWNLYLDSFPPGTNEIFRERRKADCSCCRHFIKNFGNAVVIEKNSVRTIWDFDTGAANYQPVIEALSMYLKSKPITGVFINKDKKIGTNNNYERLADGNVITWEHLYIELPDKLVDCSSKSIGELQGTYRDTRNVFKRSLEEITQEGIQIILELISQNSLYKGEEWGSVLKEFLKHKKAYTKIASEAEKENYTWEHSAKVGAALGRIGNHSIGTLLVNVSKEMDLDTAVRKYEAIVAPTNYKRPKAIFTQKMLEEAKKTIDELGYMDSLSRRYATLDDITVNNILFSNRDAAKRIAGTDVFEEMAKDAAADPKKFSKVEDISIDRFVSDILPTTTELEVFLEYRHSAGMVSLIAPEIADSKTMFKWDNNFSWAYSGNMTDSDIRTRVKAAGGNVEGVLRFSIQWNDGVDWDKNDLDAHCIEPNGFEIYISHKKSHHTKGWLDVDIVKPKQGEPAVENIAYPDIGALKEGVYKFFVHQYYNRGGRGGFRAEVEFDGQIFSFDYGRELRQKEDINVAEVMYNKKTGFSIKEVLPSSVSSRELWGLMTNQFIPVSVMMYSPNYWDEQDGIGHRHYFFMLSGCINPENPNAFFNEYLKQELDVHKRVFEALGGKKAVKDSDDQLSGLGFSSTKRNDLIVRAKGSTLRLLKIKF